ncbi:alkaline phosphatase family protein [Chengkuizengella axinellae]|uniref:Alkaline phosphatase family protein n=1 Tax=Chengkuizengella axinellae TaxID=3064388 RepID=A0ABT9J6A6_9BACL|nr:alkaline phosphatase family protein [Chengkuizengella sp. 2205SS18-9]MDP5277119.1 alkaline phosphatase family protein [Chengkuizengella sp. 2205SS18-9]
MKEKLFILGLDCIDSNILDNLNFTPNIKKMVAQGTYGTLNSTIPPITVPAWSSMLSGKDPGELGVYGFRNRRTYRYDDEVFASSHMVKFDRLWDLFSKVNKKSIIVGVPQTYPINPINGFLVSGFDSPKNSNEFCYPKELSTFIKEEIGEYLFDVTDFRNTPLDEVLDTVYSMTEKRFDLMENLIRENEWDFSILCEIGTDRIHHCFWKYHDKNHPEYEYHDKYSNVIIDYYMYIDNRIGRLLNILDDDSTTFLIVSDHGAKAMYGGVCINEILIREGWLVLKEKPNEPTKLTKDLIDWSKTKAWGDGGYYSRIFLNIVGREPQGKISPKDLRHYKEELTKLLQKIKLDNGIEISNKVYWPERIYRRVRGLAPDLIVLLGDLHWRSIGKVGYKSNWIIENDTGTDGANHSMDGVYIISGPNIKKNVRRDSSIYDITPTIIQQFNLPVNDDYIGENIFND